MRAHVKPYTTAQRLLLQLGVDPFRLEAHRSETRTPSNKSRSHTKRGPGRHHLQGKRVEATSAWKPQKGAAGV